MKYEFEELFTRTDKNCEFYKRENKELHLHNELGVLRGISDCSFGHGGKTEKTEYLLDILKVYKRTYEDCIAREKENREDALLYSIGSLRGIAYCIEEISGEELCETLSAMVFIDKAFDYNAFVKFIGKQREILSAEKMPWDK